MKFTKRVELPCSHHKTTKNKRELCEVMEMELLINLIMVNISQCAQISKHHV